MRAFDHSNYFKGSVCPICGTNEDKPVVLIPVFGTSDGSIMMAKQFHLDCIDLVFYEKINEDEEGVDYSYIGMKFENKGNKTVN